MAAQSGGSAPGYQPGFALSALQETADVRVTDPYIYAAALAGQLPASAAASVSLDRPAVLEKQLVGHVGSFVQTEHFDAPQYEATPLATGDLLWPGRRSTSACILG
jgi:hypothetical protein